MASRYRIGMLAALGVAVALAGLWWARAAPRRPQIVLVNDTGQHDYDLALRMSLSLAERKSGIENALILLPSLPPGQSIEQLAAERFSALRIGGRRQGRGILYVYAARENLLKIEVSYALEGDIPDLYCRRLEEAAKTYMLSEVPQDFLSELIITTNLRGMGAGTTAVAAPATPAWLDAGFLSGGAGAVAPGYRRTLADYSAAIRNLPPADLAAYAPAGDAAETVRRYLASLAAGIGDPRLPLLTEGSRVFRAIVPRNDEQQRRIHEFFAAGGPFRLFAAPGLALAVGQAGHSSLPIVLREGGDGLWYVDEPKAWTYFHRFEDDVDFFVKYADNPFLPALRAARQPHAERTVYGERVRTPAPPAYPYGLAAAVRAGEEAIRAEPGVAARYAELGDLYLFEMNWLGRATLLYEQAAALAPDDSRYRWRLVDLYLNGSRAEKMLAELDGLARRFPGDRELQEWNRDYRRRYALVRD
jgi:TPM domain